MEEGTYLKQDNHWIYDIPLSQMLKIIFMRPGNFSLISQWKP